MERFDDRQVSAGALSTASGDTGGALRRLRREIDLLEAQFARGLCRFIESRAYVVDGYPDPVAWLKVECRMSPGAAAERVLVARQLEQLVAAGEALESGAIGYQQAAIIAHSAAEVAPADADRVGELILAAATQTDPGRLRHVAKAIVAEVDREAIRRDANRLWTRRRLSLRLDSDSGFVIEGILDAECGARLKIQLDAVMGRLGSDDDRTAAQRRHDGLNEILKLNERGGGLPNVAGTRPHVAIQVPWAALTGEGGPPALLEGMIPLTREQLARHMCDCTMYAVVTDTDGDPFYAGPRSRSFSPAKRRLLAARDHGCVFPSCDRPAAWCDGHHIDGYSGGGLTVPANGALVCAFHHHLLHEGGWTLEHRADGTWTAIRPDGTPADPGSSQASGPAETQNSP